MRWVNAPYFSVDVTSADELDERVRMMDEAIREYASTCCEAPHHGHLRNGMTYGQVAIYILLRQSGQLAAEMNQVRSRFA